MTPQQLIQHALDHHRSGRLDQADSLYRQVLQLQPGNAPVMVLLANAVVDRASGGGGACAGEALSLCTRAAAIGPDVAEFHNSLGAALTRLNQLPDAVAAYRRALWCRRDYPDAHIGLGRVLTRQGALDEAIVHLRAAVALRPTLPPAHWELANALRRRGDLDDALASAQVAVQLDPRAAWGHNILGLVQIDRREYEPAAAHFERAISLQPDLMEAHSNLALVLMRGRRRPDEAVSVCRRAIALRPAAAQGYTNLGLALTELGQVHEAIDAHRRAVALDPNVAEAHWNLALELLRLGQFDEGWAEFVRGRAPVAEAIGRLRSRPTWDGGDLGGRTILLHGEQGFGDTVQFVRYVPLVAARGAGRIILGCQTELARLLQNFPHVAALVPGDANVPPFDVHCSLLDLPKIFRTNLSSIPANVPYLAADPALVDVWRAELGPRTPGERRVGLMWAGNPKHLNDHNRSMRLDQLTGLATVPGVRLFSLQKGPAAAQLHDVKGFDIRDVALRLNDFADTAALLSQLDLVITVDTAVAHLAGALGKQTWVLLPTMPDWRWLLERDDSPWYPTMRLFRQRQRGDWGPAVEDIVRQLATRDSGG